MNVEKIKKDFPLLKNQKNLVYLDNVATYQKPQQVIDAIKDFYENSYANVHRAIYPLGEQATQSYEDVRSKVQKFINAAHREEIIFTKGTTESINIAATSWARKYLNPGDEILVTHAEHHANLLPWQRVALETGAVLKFIELDKKTYKLKDHSNLISEKTKLVAVAHSSNVLGVMWQDGNLEKLIEQAHAIGARVLLDCAQSVIHETVDIQELNADFIAFSSHKMMGPSGVGVLFIKKELHDDVEPYQLGGSMVHSASFTKTTWESSPQKFEAGTPAIEAVIGFGAALDYIKEKINFAELKKHETNLCSRLVDGLVQLNDVVIVGNLKQIKQQSHVVCFSIKDLHAHDIAGFLGEKEIAIRAGHHCAQPLVDYLGFNSLLRVSVGVYNSVQDIDVFLEKFKEALSFFKNL